MAAKPVDAKASGFTEPTGRDEALLYSAAARVIDQEHAPSNI